MDAGLAAAREVGGTRPGCSPQARPAGTGQHRHDLRLSRAAPDDIDLPAVAAPRSNTGVAPMSDVPGPGPGPSALPTMVGHGGLTHEFGPDDGAAPAGPGGRHVRPGAEPDRGRSSRHTGEQAGARRRIAIPRKTGRTTIARTGVSLSSCNPMASSPERK